MVITGNVQVSPTHLSLGRDIVVPANLSAEALEPFRNLAQIIHLERFSGESATNTSTCPLAIMQLSHAGRQSPNVLGGRRPFASPFSPSAIALGSGRKNGGFLSSLFHRLLFQTPLEMSLGSIDDVVEEFTRGATLAVRSGFDGVQLHAAHGCMCFSLYI
jgi:2,4-dienoyl-CoA reductase-like NADH-dependent reductase (Old Yellow Enzyme family)